MSDSEILTLRSAESGTGLVFRCNWLIDRFQSTIAWIDGIGTETVLLCSVEGTADDDFPPSPPLQQMHRQEINGDPVMLAVGMAGRGHWSASVMRNQAPKDSRTFERNALVFQYAVNLRNENGWIGCSWQLGEGIGYRQTSSGCIEIQNGQGIIEMNVGVQILHVRPFGLVGCDIRLDETGNSPVRLTVTPTGKNRTAGPVRWEFETAVVPDPFKLDQ